MTLLFVYGTLFPGREPACVSDIVAQFRSVGPATLAGTLLDLGDYPGLLLEGDGSVFGHLFELPGDPLVLARLDAYEGFNPASPMTSLFRRVPATARLQNGTSADCQAYVYNHRTAGGRIIPGGSWLTRDQQADSGHRMKQKHRPIIGITLDSNDEKPNRYESPSDYARSVERAGGLPFLIPFRTDLSLIPEYVDAIDGIVFTGGNDMDPALFGETRHPKTVALDKDRQTFEFALLAEVERRRTPTLGICLGSQMMNVHRGGSLIQFLPDIERSEAIDHRSLGDNTRRHQVRLEPGTLLSEIAGNKPWIEVNTRHKQAVKTLGSGLRVNARAPDGIIEGFEDPSLPLFLAVQWHPENLAADSESHAAIFRRLVETAATKS